MALDTTNFRDKDSKVPEYRELYEQFPFIEAYSKHTDLRIKKDGPELAIGAKRDGAQDWDVHGQMQLNYLKNAGLKPEDTLLDIGCGTGRLACQAVPYLDDGKYTGIDISVAAIANCFALANTRDWYKKAPVFLVGDGTLEAVPPGNIYNYIMAHSVFTHLPPEIITRIFLDLAEIQFGQFIFTYKQAKNLTRSGLKQFQYDAAWFQRVANSNGLKCCSDDFEWPAGQHTMRVWR